MAHVWRVEHPNGDGMYRHTSTTTGEEYVNFTQIARLYNHVGVDSPERHPCPHTEDIDLGYVFIPWLKRSQYFFGFATLSQMKKWIYRRTWRKVLAMRGLVLRKYYIPDDLMMRSQHQAIFVREYAVLVETRAVDYCDKSKV